MDVVFQDNTNEQDGFSVIRGFRLIRKQEVFKKIDKKKYIIWTDCGTHFR